MNIMHLSFFVKLFLSLFALSLILFFVLPEATLMLLLKLIALSIGVSILVALFYPTIRGVRKGDQVLVSRGNLPNFLGFGRKGIAVQDGKLQKEIRIRLSNGREAIGIVEDYGGTFSIPKVRLLYEETIKE